MPELSVLMPARNAETTIALAVSSTLRAMPRDAELVVLDDASTDGTLERLQQIRDRRLVVQHGDTGVGVAAGLQRLLSTTDSRVVARMDADDVVLPGRFRAQLQALRTGPRVVFAGVIRFGHGRTRMRSTTPLRLEDRALRLCLLAVNPFGHPTLMAERTALDEVGGYRPVAAEDYELWLRIAAAGIPMLRMRRPVLGYRVYAGQTSASVIWGNRAVAEPALLASHDRLAQQLLGTTRSDPGYRDALHTAAADVPGVQGRWLRRQIATSPSLTVILDPAAALARADVLERGERTV